MTNHKKIIFISFIFFFFIFQSPIFILNSKSGYETNFNVLVSRDFKNINAKPSDFEFYFPESYSIVNSQLNLQLYSSNIIFNPEPDKKFFEYDQFQNKILKFSYLNIYGFSVNLKFSGTLKANNEVISYIPYPYDEKDIPTSLYIYLDNVSDPNVIDFATEIAKNKSNLLSIILSIKNYIDGNIKYTPFYSNRNVQRILSEKIANREELIDFYASILRVLGIPVRVCCGISIPQKYELADNKLTKMNIFSGKGVVTYLEIWTKDYGWVFFDPFFSLFSSLNNFIKFGHAKYINQLHYIYFQSKSLNITVKDDYNIELYKNDQISFTKIYDNLYSYFFIFQSNLFNNFEESLQKNFEKITKDYYTGYDDFENKRLYYIGFETKKEINLKDQSILQNFYIEKDYIFTNLILNSSIIDGSIEIKIYKGVDINEKNLIHQIKIDKNNVKQLEGGNIDINLPNLYLKKGIYVIYIFIAEPDKNTILLTNEMPNLPGFFPLIIIKNNERIKTNLILPITFKYE